MQSTEKISPNKEEARKLLRAFSGEFEFTGLWDPRDEYKRAIRLNKSSGDLFKQLSSLNSLGYGIFWNPNVVEGGFKDHNVTKIRAFFIDKDDGLLPDIIRPKPTLRVRTKRGEHVYWAVKDCPVEEFKNIQKCLARVYETDEKITNPARLMRVPGFLHMKSGPYMVRVTEANDISYSLEEFKVLIGYKEPKQVMSGDGINPIWKTYVLDDRIDRCKRYMTKVPGAIQGHGGDAHTYKIAGTGYRFAISMEDFWPILQEWNTTCWPKWSEEELMGKMKNSYQNSEECYWGDKVEVYEGEDIDSIPGRGMTLADALEEYDSMSEIQRVATGVPGIDNATGGGLPVAQSTSLIGYTGTGKSELCRQIAFKASAAGHPVIYIDMELGPSVLMRRTISQLTRIPSPKLKTVKDDLSRKKIAEAKEKIMANNLLIMDFPRRPRTKEELFDDIKGFLDTLRKYTDKPALVILDSGTRLSGGFKGEGPRVQMANFMKWVDSTLSKALNIAALVTFEGKRPQRGANGKIVNSFDLQDALSYGSESRATEYQADVVVVLKEDKEANNDEGIVYAGDAAQKSERRVWVCVAKNRDGSTGWLPLKLVFKAPYWDMYYG